MLDTWTYFEVWSDGDGNRYCEIAGTWFQIDEVGDYVRLREVDENELGLITQLISTGLNLGLGLFGASKARKQQEQARDQQREAAYAQMRQIKEAVLACQLPAEQAVQAATDVMNNYYQWADQNLTVQSVRQSAENFRNQPGGFLDSIRIIQQAAQEARAKCAPRRTATAGDSVGASLSGSVGGVPVWALALGGLLLVTSMGRR